MDSAVAAPAISLRRNVVWALAGNVGYAACQWGVLVVIAKLASAADLGRFALGLALSAPVMILANLQLRALQATDARRAHAFGVYLGLRCGTTVVALAAIAGIAGMLGYRAATLWLIVIVALAKSFEALSDVVLGLLQQGEDLRRVAVSMLIKGVMSLSAVWLLLVFTGSVSAAALALALAWGTVLVAYDMPNAARRTNIRPIFERSALTALAWLALPMGCVSGLNSLTANVPRYAIEANLGSTALGHFAALAYLLVAGTQPILALGAAASPRLAHYFCTDRAAYRLLAHRTVALAAGLGLLIVGAAALGGRSFLTLAYGPEYAEHAPALTWLAAAAAASFVAGALGYAVTAARRFPPQLVIAALAFAVCALASAALVPRHGLLGGAWAVLAGEATRLVCLSLLYAATCAVGLRSEKSGAASPVAPRGLPARV